MPFFISELLSSRYSDIVLRADMSRGMVTWKKTCIDLFIKYFAKNAFFLIKTVKLEWLGPCRITIIWAGWYPYYPADFPKKEICWKTQGTYFLIEFGGYEKWMVTTGVKCLKLQRSIASCTCCKRYATYILILFDEMCTMNGHKCSNIW